MAAPARVGPWRINVPKTLRVYRASGIEEGHCTISERPNSWFHLDRVDVELFSLGDDVVVALKQEPAEWRAGGRVADGYKLVKDA